MSIAILPSHTVRAIGSTQALTDSASVVKELVDNALDAHSNNITIELSTNVLDVIQVKDNGHGIAPADYKLLGQRYCTSKIKDLNDLANIGGTSLGFRGEALASAVEISGGLLISTRIAGEATGVSLKVSHKGEVENESPISQGVGTIVRITDFLETLPVRRQTALKDSAKQLAKIKRTLQAYALARPSVRLALKVLKSKNDKDNWTYAPKHEASVSDAAVKIIGKKATDQCQWLVWDAGIPATQPAFHSGEWQERDTNQDPTYSVEAMIPKAGCDLTAISSIGQYISVDSRPVSCSRGTFKKIVQLFKSYLQSSCTTANHQKVTNPFICMNLVCPPGSYDANVEPAKDDVLFTDSPRVLDVVEVFFRSIYGELASKEKSTSKGKSSVSKPQAFDILLAKRKSPATTQPTPPDMPRNESPVDVDTGVTNGLFEGHNLPMDQRRTGLRRDSSAVKETFPIDTQPSPTHHITGAQHTWQQSMYHSGDLDEPPDTPTVTQDQDIDAEEDLRDVRVSNPWTLAKLNAPLRLRDSNGLSSNGQLLTPAKHHDGIIGELSSPLRMDPAATDQAGLPSPEKSDALTPFEEPSDDSFPYPLRRWGKAQRGNASKSNPPPSDDAPSSSLLDTWMQRPSALPRGTSQEDLFVDQHDPAVSRPRRDFVLASELPQGTPLSRIPDLSQKPARKAGLRKQREVGNANKPFKPPVVHDEERVWFDHLGPSSSNHSPKKKTARQSQQLPPMAYPDGDGDGENDPILDSSPSEPQHPGIALTMDYEARKAAATAQRRAYLREQAKSSRTSSDRLEEEMQGTQIKISASQQSQHLLPASSSPHRNRYNAAVAALHAPSSTSPFKAGNDAIGQLDPKDPRAYLLRSGGKKNVRLAMMPLETVSQPEVRELCQVCDTRGLRLLGDGVRDGVRDGKGGEGFVDVRPEEVEVWVRRVRELVAALYCRGEGDGGAGVEVDVVIDMQATLWEGYEETGRAEEERA
ncbi:MAG: hypothetical protein LQ350_004181 [Teloschistes chrysophthalmus]|nr:MAG: hypothetical protein LQ350_004181 [Niorma chrysophthalma]